MPKKHDGHNRGKEPKELQDKKLQGEAVPENQETVETSADSGVDVRVSNKTHAQTDINNRDGFNLDESKESATGEDMGIRGVSDSVKINYSFGENSFEATLASSWNSLKNIEVSSNEGADVSVNNFVHADISLGGVNDSNVRIEGAKRGNVETGSGNDTVQVNAQTNNAGWSNTFNIHTGDGDDNVLLDGDKGHAIFNVFTGAGDDKVEIFGGEYKTSKISGGLGDDTLLGGDKHDKIFGNEGDDIIEGRDGNDILSGGEGNDTIRGGDGNNKIFGDEGTDHLYGGQHNDFISGGDDTDFIAAGNGNDKVDAGDGNDYVWGGNGNDKIIGNDGDDKLYGQGGNDTIIGGDGDDIINGGSGKDNIHAGDGNDTIVYDAEDRSVHGGKGEDTLKVDGDVDLSKAKVHGMDRVDMTDGESDDAIEVSMKDTKISDDKLLKITGDEGDSVSEFDYDVRLDDVTDGDVTFAVFEQGSKQIWVQHGLSLGENIVEPPVVETPEETPVEEILFLNESAGYKNTVGYYVVDDEGNIGEVGIAFENASKKGSGGDLIAGVSTADLDVPEGSTANFFIIANGYSKNNGYKNMDGEFKFISVTGGDANINDEIAPVLILEREDGSAKEVKGNVFHAQHDNLNVDGISHANIDVSEDGLVTYHFEDLKNGGDKDFDDSVFQVNMQGTNFNLDDVELPEGVQDVPDDGDGNGENPDDGENPVNVAPVATDATIEALEDGEAITTTVLGTDEDLPEDTLAYTLLTTPEQGEVINNGDGTFTFDPLDGFQELGEGETTDVTFEYQVTDAAGLSDTGVVTVTVTGQNDAPQTVDVTATETTFEGGADVVIDVNGLGTDIDGEVVGYEVLQAPEHGVVVDNGDGTFTYTPGENFPELAEGQTENVTFTYVARDNNGAVSEPATVTIAVAGVNNIPEVQDFTIDAWEDGEPVVIDASATDFDGLDNIEYMLSSQPNEGQATIDGYGEFTFDPVDDFQDLDDGETRDIAFHYQATDETGAYDVGIINIVVHGVNDAPTVEDLTVVAQDDTGAITRPFPASDVDGDDLTFALTSTLDPLTEGTLVNNGDGTFTYTPVDGLRAMQDGEELDIQFTYDVTDGDETVSGAVNINIQGKNEAPVAEDITETTTDAGDPVIIDIGSTVTDGDGDDTTVEIVTDLDPNTQGTLEDNGDGTYTFVPAESLDALQDGESETIEIEYTVTDGQETVTHTVTVVVEGSNNAPEAQPIEEETTADEPVTIDIGSQVVDSDGDDTEITIVTDLDPETGQIIDNGDGTFTFEPGEGLDELAEGETQDIEIEYEVSDGENTTTETVTITVTGVNDAPNVQDVTLTVNEDGSVSGAYIASDVDGDVLDIHLISTPNPETQGTVVDNGDGTFTFTPADALNSLAVGETQQVSFIYAASDGMLTSSATIRVYVTGSNDGPVVENTAFHTTEAEGVALLDITTVASDPDNGAELTYQINTMPLKGELINNGDGTFFFNQNGEFDSLSEGETEDVTFTFTVTDEHGEVSNMGTATITVTGSNSAPTAEAVAVTTDEDSSVHITLLGSDADLNDSLTYSVPNPPSEDIGTVSITGNQLTFTPGDALDSLAPGETTVVSFDYAVTDGDETVTETVTITVTGSNDAPIIENITYSAVEDSGNITVPFNGVDPEGDDIHYVVTDAPLEDDGYVTVDNINGTFTFVPGVNIQSLGEGEQKTVVFRYQADDGVDSSDVKQVQITFTGTNDAPTTDVTEITIGEDDSATTFDLNFTDVDTNVNNLMFTLLDAPSPQDAVITLNDDGTVSVTPGINMQALNTGEVAELTFSYAVSDGEFEVTGEATITVVGSTDFASINDIFFSQPQHAVENFKFTVDLGASAVLNLSGDEAVTATLAGGGALPDWLDFDPETLMLSGVPSASDQGELSVEVRVADGGSVSIEVFTLYVNTQNLTNDTEAYIGTNYANVYTGDENTNYISSLDGDDVIDGAEGADVLYGGAGDDTLNGNAGDDTFLLYGNAGIDGSDAINGGEGVDKILISTSSSSFLTGGFDAVAMSVEEFEFSRSSGGKIYGDSGDNTLDFTGVDLINTTEVNGGSGNDTIFLTDGIDGRIRGGNGNDTIYAGDSDDELYGDGGSDNIFAGGGNDLITVDVSDQIIDGGDGFDTILHYATTIDFGDTVNDYDNIELFDMSGYRDFDLTLSLEDVVGMTDENNTMLFVGETDDVITTDGVFSVDAGTRDIDTNGDGVADTTFKMYGNITGGGYGGSQVFIGIELDSGVSIDGEFV